MADKEKKLRHVGFIMDGNGRWAKERNRPRTFGHKKGADTIVEVVEECFESGVEVVRSGRSTRLNSSHAT